MTVGVVILAAGSGSRAKTEIPKQYMNIAGVSVLRRGIDAFLRHPKISYVQVVIAQGDEELYHNATKGLNLLNHTYGGKTRQESVLNGLKSLQQHKEDITTVLIHDGARPFVSSQIINNVIEKVQSTGQGAIPALPVVDTLKKALAGVIQATQPRENLWQAQTPQGFPFALILSAHLGAKELNLTDDAAIAEHAGINVHICEGSIDNFKLTQPEDFIRAEKQMGLRSQEIRTGLGIDVHKLVKAPEKTGVTLCGVNIAHDKSLKGHSDADVALHALTDALLGAMAEGDIGLHFPPTDKKWRGVSSDVFLKHANTLLKNKNGRILNIDLTIVCEAPKILPHREKMQKKVAEILSITADKVSIKATTSEKLGFMGRGEGILTEAVATIALD